LSFHTFIREHSSPALECTPRNSSLDVSQYGKILTTVVRRNQGGGCAKFSGCLSFGFKARSQNCDKRPLDLSCLSFRPSVLHFICPHGTTLLPLDGFSWNLILA